MGNNAERGKVSQPGLLDRIRGQRPQSSEDELSWKTFLTASRLESWWLFDQRPTSGLDRRSVSGVAYYLLTEGRGRRALRFSSWARSISGGWATWEAEAPDK